MTFFVDRDLGPRVGNALRSVRVPVVNHVDRFPPNEPDDSWIPTVSAQGLVILTRDRKIRTRHAERQVFEAARSRCFVVTIGASTPLDDLRALLIAWPQIEERIATVPRPFMYGVSRDGKLLQFIPVSGPGGPAARKGSSRD